jgi:hypothetical protein
VAVAAPWWIEGAANRKIRATHAALDSLRVALDLYERDTGSYPCVDSVKAMTETVGRFAVSPSNEDAWGHSLAYRCVADGHAFVLASSGSDGVFESSTDRLLTTAFTRESWEREASERRAAESAWYGHQNDTVLELARRDTIAAPSGFLQSFQRSATGNPPASFGLRLTMWSSAAACLLLIGAVNALRRWRDDRAVRRAAARIEAEQSDFFRRNG